MDDFNPYAAPEASLSTDPAPGTFDEVRGIWQDGDILVMVKIAQLPHRCVKCNAPATSLIKRSLSWHSPALYLMVIFPGLLFYVIIALIVRKTAKVIVPLCEEHSARRSRNIMIAWILALSGIALMFTPLLDGSLTFMIGIGLILLLTGMIVGSTASQILAPQKIDETHAWLKRVDRSFLATLPPLPDYSRPASKAKVAIDQV